MHTITTTARSYDLRLTLNEALAMKAKGVDLLDTETLSKAVEDPLRFLTILELCLVACGSLEDEPGKLTEFRLAITPSFASAVDAFLGEYADFCQALGRKTAAAAARKIAAAKTTIEDAGAKELDETADEKINQLVNNAVAKIRQDLDQLSQPR